MYNIILEFNPYSDESGPFPPPSGTFRADVSNISSLEQLDEAIERIQEYACKVFWKPYSGLPEHNIYNIILECKQEIGRINPRSFIHADISRIASLEELDEAMTKIKEYAEKVFAKPDPEPAKYNVH